MTEQEKIEIFANYLPYKVNLAQPRLGKTEAYLLYGIKIEPKF